MGVTAAVTMDAMTGHYKTHPDCVTVAKRLKLIMKCPAPWEDTPPYATMKSET